MEGKIILSRAEQSRAEQSRAEQSRAEQITNVIITYIKHPAVGIVRFRTISTVGCFCFAD